MQLTVSVFNKDDTIWKNNDNMQNDILVISLFLVLWNILFLGGGFIRTQDTWENLCDWVWKRSLIPNVVTILSFGG